MSFTAYLFDPRVAAGVAACGYKTPTPIQAQAIPPALEGRDVLGLAQTGTGKTAAYALPILNRLVGGPRGALRALVVAPTRELAEQIRGAVQQLGARTGLRATAIYGGVGMGRQIEALRRGSDIVVACPGRLLDHIRQRTIDLARLEVLVLDEADMMLDMGFLPDVRRILTHVPARRQSLLFSATMPAEIRLLARELLREPATLTIRPSAPVETVSHALYPVAQHLKTALLMEILSRTETGSVLVFTRTKHRAKRLGAHLARAGHRAASLQGNLSQAARQAALNGFREGRYQILVATDIAARGIDISRVSHVINFDIPDTTDAYTHRIGRTGRAQRSGEAFTLVTAEDASKVREIERVLGVAIERRHMEGFDYQQGSVSGGKASAALSAAPHPRREHDHRRRTTHPHNGTPPRHQADMANSGRPSRHPFSDATRRTTVPVSRAKPGIAQPHDRHPADRQPRHRTKDHQARQGANRRGQPAQSHSAAGQSRARRRIHATTRQPHQAYSPGAVQGFRGKVYSARDPYVSRGEGRLAAWRDKSRHQADTPRIADDPMD
ncbi:MAG: DEAD/DEAH box helicase [Candidatus Sumerlaeaceae bacterium]|nr:DEAD/DEAH box helicase [Candidatus Sumerlaeaceae bacterium]